MLAAGIAHDFNNLIGGMLGNVDLARVSIDDTSRPAAYLDRALKTFERARELTRKLLTFAKGNAPMKTAVSLPAFLRDAVAQSLAAFSNIHASFDIDETIGGVEADENQLRQALTNVLQNAVDSMPQGGAIALAANAKEIDVGQVFGLSRGRYVEITVTDHGCGIPEALRAKVFDPFFSTKELGSGLGLALCHSILHKHNGAITLESRVGQGTAVRLYLPA